MIPDNLSHATTFFIDFPLKDEGWLAEKPDFFDLVKNFETSLKDTNKKAFIGLVLNDPKQIYVKCSNDKVALYITGELIVLMTLMEIEFYPIYKGKIFVPYA